VTVRAWCYLCEHDVAMLDDPEWERLAPLLDGRLQQVMQYRRENGASLAEALKASGLNEPVLAAYRHMTGESVPDVDHLAYHRRSRYGADCPRCGKPLRTPRASYCLPCYSEATRAAAAAGDRGSTGAGVGG
jgi:hypothetical protein